MKKIVVKLVLMNEHVARESTITIFLNLTFLKSSKYLGENGSPEWGFILSPGLRSSSLLRLELTE